MMQPPDLPRFDHDFEAMETAGGIEESDSDSLSSSSCSEGLLGIYNLYIQL